MSNLKHVLRVLFTLALALLIGGIIIQLSGKDAINGYKMLFDSALGNQRAIADTLLKSTPLIFTGLATVIAFKAGIFNVGVEGSLYVGAFAAAWVGFTFTSLPTLLIVPLAFLAAGLVGGLWGAIPGYLKAYLQVDEVVTTIMLNYVAILFTEYLVLGPFLVQGMSNAMSEQVAIQAQLPRIFNNSQWNPSFFLAIGTFFIVWFLMRKMTLGYEIRVLGTNLNFARWSGIPICQVIVFVMFLSGFIGGLAGAGQVLGVHYRFIAGFSRGLGFDGIVIALLGRNTAVGALLAALFLGALRSGSATMEMFTGIPRDLVDIVQALIIFFIAVDVSIDWWSSRKNKSELDSQDAPSLKGGKA